MAANPKLLQAVLSPSLQKAEIVVSDDGVTRKIDVLWESKDPSPLTEHWWSSVCGECDFQKQEEKRGVPDFLRG